LCDLSLLVIYILEMFCITLIFGIITLKIIQHFCWILSIIYTRYFRRLVVNLLTGCYFCYSWQWSVADFQVYNQKVDLLITAVFCGDIGMALELFKL
jgi:hypothetical protein